MSGELTRNGVCYDLSKSPFWCDCEGYRFFFSSETHRRKFVEKAAIRKAWLSDSLSRRFHVRVDASLLAVFQLYMQIETRGFLVDDFRFDEGISIGRYDSPDSLSFTVVD